MQGLGAELVFALFLYRNWRLPVALLAGAGAGLAMAVNDLVLWYAGAAPDVRDRSTSISAVVGGAVHRRRPRPGSPCAASPAPGALDRFAAGRELRTV